MNAPEARVDVRDMLCAQALAVVAQALERLRVGEVLEVVYNAQDVERDLLLWAQERHHRVTAVNGALVRIERRS